jgi:hypothetical protein
MDSLAAASFQNAKPYPWINPSALIRPEAFDLLVETLPDVSQFEPYFQVKRSHGQASHDRWVLNWSEGLELAPPWREFVDEIRSPRYAAFLRRLFDRDFVSLSMHWHYTPSGCSVSPHCDAAHKLGSHIFYFNTAADWEESWGGETLILDDKGRFSRRSAPEFGDFDELVAGRALGNYSLLFQRRGDSWHGVREINCPQGHYRKVFIVVINGSERSLVRRMVDRARGKPAEAY